MSQWGVVPLVSNASGDSYFYQITVYTGMRKGAGTKSRIGFVLVGDYADSGVRQLTDDKNSKVRIFGSMKLYTSDDTRCRKFLSLSFVAPNNWLPFHVTIDYAHF